MPALTIGFHDVVEDLRFAKPIAPGHTVLYTVNREQLRRHLLAILDSAGPQAVGRVDRPAEDGTAPRVALTFDDGAVSSYRCIAPELDRFDWPGHFLVTTGWIGQPGFLDAGMIRDLDRRGHAIGTHSATHPDRISQLRWNDVLREWTDSGNRLSDILGHAITMASVPNGYYLRPVAEAAAAAGIRILFTSEPTTRIESVDGCLVLGRYAIRRSTPPAFSGALASGAIWPRSREAAAWLVKKAAKRLTGRFYKPIRNLLVSNLSNRPAIERKHDSIVD